MSNGWKVKFEDNELDGEQVASFSSKQKAEAWVKSQKIQQRYDPTGFEVIDGPYYEEARKINEMFNKLGLKAEVIAESWKHEFDDKPENQWGEKWKLLDNGNAICCQIQDAVDDCQLDPSEAGPKVDSLSIASVHIVDGGNIIVSLYGGANGGEIPGQCNFKLYLALVKKLVAKLLDSGMFEDAWLVDWENDCLDDTYALRFVLKPNEKTLQTIKEKGMLDFLNESEGAQPNGYKIWIDDIRPAPKGYTWLKSVNDFINFVYDIHDRDGSLEAIQVIDLDHDAGDYQADGGDYIRCLDFLEFFGAEDMNIRIHSANPVGVKNMRAIIRRNGWNEVHDIIEEEDHQLGTSRTIDEADGGITPAVKHPTYQNLIDALIQVDATTPIHLVANGNESHVSYHYGSKHELDHYEVHVDGIVLSNMLTKHGIWKCIVRKLPTGQGCTTHVLANWLQENVDTNEHIAIWPGFADYGHAELLDNDGKPTHIHNVMSFQLNSDGTLKLSLADVELHESLDEQDERSSGSQELSNGIVNEVEKSQTMKATEKNTKGKDNSKPKVAQEVKDYTASRDSIVKALKNASAQFQKAATNNDPEQFSKIVVAFDDLAAGVGSYDFKKKEVLKEDDEDSILPAFDENAFLSNAKQNGIDCTSAKVRTFTFPGDRKLCWKIDVDGDFPDDRAGCPPMKQLSFNYKTTTDQYASKGWHQGIRCRNKWNEEIIDVLSQMYPDGIYVEEANNGS